MLGVLHVGTLTPRRFDADDARPAAARGRPRRAGDRARAALRAPPPGRGAAAQPAAREPARRSPGLELAARYLPAAAAASLGGDWYDVFRPAGGTIGRRHRRRRRAAASPAAALMAQLRTALRAYAFDGHPPADVVGRLNRLTGQLSAATMTTLGYVVLDPAPQTATSSAPGTCRRSLIDPDGRASYLPVESDVALGVARSARYREQRFELARGREPRAVHRRRRRGARRAARRGPRAAARLRRGARRPSTSCATVSPAAPCAAASRPTTWRCWSPA